VLIKRQAHASIVLSQDVIDYAPLFVEIADAYVDQEMYAQARPIYEMLGQDAGVCCPPHHRKLVVHVTRRPVVCMSSSRWHCATTCSDNFRMPLRSMEPVCPIALFLPSMKRIIFAVLSLDSSLNDVKMRLAGIYEVLHEPRKALDLVYQGTSWESFC